MRHPVRRTSSRHHHVCHRSRRRQTKRAPYLCAPSASDPAGERKRKRPPEPASATAAPWERHHLGQQKRPTTRLLCPPPPKTSLESSVDAGSSGRERRSKPHASCPEQTRARVWEKDWLTRAGQHNAAGLPLPPALSVAERFRVLSALPDQLLGHLASLERLVPHSRL